LSSPQFAPVRNQLLASLPPDVLLALLPRFTSVVLTMRQVIYTPDTPVEAVYFPESGMFSLVDDLEDGMRAEVGVIGREGMLGMPLLAGIDSSFVEAQVQMSGTALRMSAAAFNEEVEANAAFRRILLRYSEAMQAQVMQTAACNANHDLEQRLARWLLMAHDRAEGDELPLTQDFMAVMLGVHRPSITVTAGILQRAGLIRYVAGRITVLDRASLEAAACECHGVVQRRFDILLG
jgi:CRP-like cAMP-binding protein